MLVPGAFRSDPRIKRAADAPQSARQQPDGPVGIGFDLPHAGFAGQTVPHSELVESFRQRLSELGHELVPQGVDEDPRSASPRCELHLDFAFSDSSCLRAVRGQIPPIFPIFPTATERVPVPPHAGIPPHMQPILDISRPVIAPRSPVVLARSPDADNWTAESAIDPVLRGPSLTQELTAAASAPRAQEHDPVLFASQNA